MGAISYKIIGGAAIDLGLAPTDLKAISAIIVIIFIGYNNASFFSLKKKGGEENAGNKKLVKEL